VWAAVTRAALECLGGQASLQRLYAEIEGHRPTTNTFWQAKVRQVVQQIAVRVDDGVWALPERAAA
jgi:site-specific DNA-methyltransferase (adenine-specific)